MYGQSDTSTITGFVKDPSGAMVSNAQVTAISEATQESHTVNTDKSGYYSLSNLSAGFYSLSVHMQGFKS